MPEFLKMDGKESGPEDVLAGLEMIAYFLEHWVFVHHSRGIPEARQRFQNRFLGKVESSKVA